MRTSSVGRRAGIALALLLVVGLGAPATPVSAAAKRAGVYVTGQGRVPGANASGVFARTPAGAEHMLVSRAVPGRKAGTNRLFYLTRPHGKKRWIEHRVPDSLGHHPVRLAEPIRSLDGERLVYFVYRSTGLQYADVSASATHLPALRNAPHSFRGTVAHSDRPRYVVGGVGVPHHELALLVTNCPSACSDEIWTYARHRFSRSAILPKPALKRVMHVKAITRNPTTGEMAVSANGSPPDSGPHPPTGVWVWTKLAGKTWTAPTDVFPLSVADNYTTSSTGLTSALQKITIGVVAHSVGNGSSDSNIHNDREYVVRQSPRAWIRLMIPLVDPSDGPPRMVADPRTGLVHFLFKSRRGIVHQTLERSNAWSLPHYLTYSGSDTPLAATLTGGGSLVAAYVHR